MSLPADARARLAKLIPMLASDRDGEVVATVRAIGRTLAGAGADFHALAAVVGAGAPAPGPKAGPAWDEPTTRANEAARAWAAMAEELARKAEQAERAYQNIDPGQFHDPGRVPWRMSSWSNLCSALQILARKVGPRKISHEDNIALFQLTMKVNAGENLSRYQRARIAAIGIKMGMSPRLWE